MDTNLFLYNSGDKVIYVLVYVDYIILTSNDMKLVDKLIQHLNDKFAFKVLSCLHYIMGFEVTRSKFGLSLNQTKYAQNLLIKVKMFEAKPCTTLLPLAVS